MWRVMQSAAGPVKVRPKGAAWASTRPSRLVIRAMPNWQVLSIRNNQACCTGIDKIAPALLPLHRGTEVVDHSRAFGRAACGQRADLSAFHAAPTAWRHLTPPRAVSELAPAARCGIAGSLVYETSLGPGFPQNLRTKAHD